MNLTLTHEINPNGNIFKLERLFLNIVIFIPSKNIFKTCSKHPLKFYPY